RRVRATPAARTAARPDRPPGAVRVHRPGAMPHAPEVPGSYGLPSCPSSGSPRATDALVDRGAKRRANGSTALQAAAMSRIRAGPRLLENGPARPSDRSTTMTIRNPGGDGRPGTRAADGDPQQADAVAGADRDADAPAAGTTLGPRFEQLRAAWSDLIRRSL